MGKIEERPGKVSFTQAWKDYFMGYVDFKGRSTRGGFWWVALILILLSFTASITLLIIVLNSLLSVFTNVAQLNMNDAIQALGNVQIPLIIILIVSLGFILPTLALFVRRLRDVGIRGRGQLVIFGILMVIGMIIYFVAMKSYLEVAVTQGYIQNANAPLDIDSAYTQEVFGKQSMMMIIFGLLRSIVGIVFLVITVLPTGSMATRKESGVMAFFFKNKRFYDDIEE